MERVTGIGGIFFRARDAKALQEWYRRHLGIDVQDWGGTVFRWAGEGTTTWSVFSDGKYFEPGTAPFMVNYRVADIQALVRVLRDEGCDVVGEVAQTEYGQFGWVMDPEGNKIELWEPPPGS